MTTVRLKSVLLKHGCEMTLWPKGEIKERAGLRWDADIHGVELAYLEDRVLVRMADEKGTVLHVPIPNVRCWVEDAVLPAVEPEPEPVDEAATIVLKEAKAKARKGKA